jgi:CRISPR-associated protein (Cas_Cmr5)
MVIETKSQVVASYVVASIETAKAKTPNLDLEALSDTAKSLCFGIHQNGLLQGIAQLVRSADASIVESLSALLAGALLPPAPPNPNPTLSDLASAIAKQDAAHYIQSTRKALTYLSAAFRYSRAMHLNVDAAVKPIDAAPLLGELT